MPVVDATSNDNHKNLYVQILWDEPPNQTMPSIWQDMHRVQKVKPL